MSVLDDIKRALGGGRGRNPRGKKDEGWRSYGPGKFNSIVDSYVNEDGEGEPEEGDITTEDRSPQVVSVREALRDGGRG